MGDRVRVRDMLIRFSSITFTDHFYYNTFKDKARVSDRLSE